MTAIKTELVPTSAATVSHVPGTIPRSDVEGALDYLASSLSGKASTDAFVGDSGSGGAAGLVPAPAAGDAAADKFLKADGTWAEPAASSGAQLDVAQTWTERQTFRTTDYPVRVVNNQDAGSFVEVARFEGDRATPTNGDSAQIGFYLSNGSGTQVEAARMSWALSDVTASSEDSVFTLMLQTGGSPETFLRLDSSALSPASNNLIALGTASLKWADLFLADGAVINFNNGNVTLTHSTGLLTLSSALSVGTSNAITAGTIELGHASANTLSASGGVLSVEGKAVATLSTAQTWSAPQVASAGTLTASTGWDGTTKSRWTAAVSSAFQIANPSSAVDGQFYHFEITYSGSGPVTFGSQFKGLSAITWTNTSGKKDRLTAQWNSANSELEYVGHSLDVRA